MKRFIEFLFFRWKSEIVKRGTETWTSRGHIGLSEYEYGRTYVDYRLTNKFDGSVKIKRKYLN